MVFLMLKSAHKNSKGTVTYLSDVIVGITSMFSTLFMLFVSSLVVFIMHANITSVVYGDILYDESAAGMWLTSMIDSKYESTQLKDLLAYSIWFEKDSFSYAGKTIDMKAATASAIRKFSITEYSATLTTGTKTTVLAKAGVRPQKELKCVEHKIFAEGKTGTLSFCATRSGR